ncbi:hypothetical protein ACFL5Z_17680 [Planctomycetota bacterium]
MNHVSQGRMKNVYRRTGVSLLIALSVIVHAMCVNCVAGNEEGVEHFKMISTVEYTGDGQFRNQTESSYSVMKEVFANDRVRYSFVVRDPNWEAGKKASSDFSFVIDRSTGLMSAAGRDMAFWAQVHNTTVKSLDKVTKEYIGKAWKQSVNLASLDKSPINEVSFTLTAIEVSTKAFGDMIAVRALSEPFFLTMDKGPLRCKINSVYLFDLDIDNVYLSISVFEAGTDAKGIKETLRHEVATYRTNSAGKPLDLSDIGKDFEALVAKVGLRKDSLQITKETDLPKWANSKGITAAQVANICAGAVCEGALNPVGMITIPTARSLSSQTLGGAAGGTSILARLINGIGWNVPTAIGAGLITWGVIEAADDDGSDYP